MTGTIIAVTVFLCVLIFAIGYMAGEKHERKKQQIEMMKHEREFGW